MDDLTSELRDGFQDAGFDIAEASVNRDRVRIAVRDPSASGGDLRDLTHDILGADSVMGLNVTTESSGDQEPTTVVSFRYRS